MSCRSDSKTVLGFVGWNSAGSGESVASIGSSISRGLSELRARKQAQRIRQAFEGSCSQWVVVGNSFGGWVALWLALDFPEKVSRLVLFSPAGLKNQGKGMFVNQPTDPLLEAQTEEDFMDSRLVSIQAPLLLAWGKQDTTFPLSEGYLMRSLLPTRTVWRELDSCGHTPQLECPREVVQATIDMLHFGAI